MSPSRLERMSELPPDLPRLRLIRDWLAQERAQNEVIGTYLRLEEDRVNAAISDVTPSPAEGYRLQPLRSARHRTVMHLDTCWVAGGARISEEEARAALTDAVAAPMLEFCDACRPEATLRATLTDVQEPARGPAPDGAGPAGATSSLQRRKRGDSR